jgi:DNA replication and repair protein RecF
LQLEEFRNYPSLDWELQPGFSVLAGQNAQGKTNILEALYLLSTTRLLRGTRDSEAIRSGAAQAQAKVELWPTRTTLTILLEHGVRKRARLNELNVPRAADLIGRMPSICISAEDLSLARGEPTDRRLFLDLELSSRYPAYLRHLTVYRRALEQRNALLRQFSDRVPEPSLFEPWEAELALHGAAMRQTRQRFVEELAPMARDYHAQIGENEGLELGYRPKDEATDAEALVEALTRSRSEDLRRGGTSVGPHRDDLGLSIDGREVRLFGSQGQQRTAVLAIKLATLATASQEYGVPPLLLLDDILSDLDAHRRDALVELVLAVCGQSVLTCTDVDAIGPRILSQAAVYQVRQGRVSGP